MKTVEDKSRDNCWRYATRKLLEISHEITVGDTSQENCWRYGARKLLEILRETRFNHGGESTI